MATDLSADPSNRTLEPGGRLRAIEESLAGLTDAEKVELIARIARSIRFELSDPAERAQRQKENRDRLMAELAKLPTTPQTDGLSNRDHDQILYGSKS